MRKIAFLLTLLLVIIQYPLWFGRGGWFRVGQIEEALNAQRAHNEVLSRRNQQLAADVWDLKTGTESIEERARYELGLIHSDEIFFYFVEPD